MDLPTLCSRVEAMARRLDILTAEGHSGTTRALMVRLELKAMVTELVTRDLLERIARID